MTDTGSVTLSTSDSTAAISEKHPVGIDFALADEEAGDSVPVLEGITIQAPSEEDEAGNVYSSITSAEIEVEDADTVAYAEKYGEPETKALYYVNDAARDYRAAHLEEEETTTIKNQDVVTASAQAKGNQVRIDIRTEKDKDLILGYEMVRSQYGSEEADVIPKGSLVFTGTYKGNPAYNIVLLYDTEGNVIGAKDGNVEAEQVIFADVPVHRDLGETSDGIWVYYVLLGQWNEETLKGIKGVRGELYRVDNATTLEGERKVSDTMILEFPDTIPEITLTGNK